MLHWVDGLIVMLSNMVSHWEMWVFMWMSTRQYLYPMAALGKRQG
jgi:hypothetical protein